MSGEENRRGRPWAFGSFFGKWALYAAVFLSWMVFMGNGKTAFASQPGTVSGEGTEESQDLDDEDDFDLSDYEGDVTEDELDRALEEYIRQMDMDSLIQNGEAAGKVEDPDLRLEEEGGRFKYTLPNGNFFVSSVPNGMITSGAVDLELSEGTVGLISFNDEAETFTNFWHFTKKGSYCVRLLMFQQPGGMAADYNLYEVHFYFTIIGEKDNTLGAFTAPEGFDIKEVRRDNKPLTTGNGRCFFLGEDGYYEIRCESKELEGIYVETRFTRDTTAPFLSFSEEGGREGTPGPIEFFPSEENCVIYMSYNGNRGYAVGNVLSAAGSYELSIEDAAGNRRVYNLRIRQTYDLMDKRLLLLVLVFLAVAAGRLAAARRDMRVL